MSREPQALEFFSFLREQERKDVESRTRSIRVRKGQVIIEHRSRSTDVFFLVEGELRVLLYSGDGREVSVRTLKRGQMFGELAAIDGLPRSATVLAVIPSLVISMTRNDFQTCIQSSAGLAMWLANQFATQVRTLTEKIFELSALNVRHRLYCELLRLALVAGVADNRATVDPTPTHAELANRIGTHREAVTRELRDLARRKVLRQERRVLQVLDFNHLSRIVQRLSGQSVHVRPAPPKLANAAEFVRVLEMEA